MGFLLHVFQQPPSSSSLPPPPHFHPSHLFISLLSLSPAASDSLPGKSYLPPGLCVEVSCSICVRRWLWVMGFLCPHTSCLPHINAICPCVTVHACAATPRSAAPCSQTLPLSLKRDTHTHTLNSFACVCLCPCYFLHCLRTSVNTRVGQAHTDRVACYQCDCRHNTLFMV